MEPGIKAPSTEAGTAGVIAGGPNADLTGQTLGDFQVLRRLGDGGMGHVYLAEQISLKRKVALKILKGELANSPTSLKRFKAEAEAVARATHANIVQVYAIGECRGLHYMALEYVDGRNLREYVEKKGSPGVLVVLSIIRQVAAALHRASELGLVHRDIKPENILLTRKGEVKVADFGLTQCFEKPLHLTESGVAMGTPLYMSPEQVEGKPVDPRTDIYSFGLTCYFMLTGHPPFTGQNPFEVALQHVKAEPRPLAEIRPDLPPALCSMVHKMMAKLPDQRYQSGRELVKEVAQLRDVLVGVTSQGACPLPAQGAVPVTTAVVPVPPAKVLPPRRAWLNWVGICCVLLAFLAGCLWAWVRNSSLNASISDQKGSNPGKHQRLEETAPLEPLLSSRQEREQWLVAELRQYGKPGEEREQVERGLNYSMELGLMYLESWRLDEAAKLFNNLDRPEKDNAYRSFGRLGQAILLAFKDKPKQSNMLFRDELRRLWGRGGQKHFRGGETWYAKLLRTHRQFRRTMASALEHNLENDRRHFLPMLRLFLHPPGAFRFARAREGEADRR
jgi:predicted Ser/Thr protein kinase